MLLSVDVGTQLDGRPSTGYPLLLGGNYPSRCPGSLRRLVPTMWQLGRIHGLGVGIGDQSARKVVEVDLPPITIGGGYHRIKVYQPGGDQPVPTGVDATPEGEHESVPGLKSPASGRPSYAIPWGDTNNKGRRLSRVEVLSPRRRLKWRNRSRVSIGSAGKTGRKPMTCRSAKPPERPRRSPRSSSN